MSHPSWIPAPIDLIRKAGRTRWVRHVNEAPELVGYLTIRADLNESPGSKTTDRQWAAYLGWSRHAAGCMLRRVRRELALWNGFPGFQPSVQPNRNQKQPVEVNDSGDLEAVFSQSSTKSSHVSATRARVPFSTTTTTVKDIEQKMSLRALWDQVEVWRKEALPGCRPLRWTASLQEGIRSRVKEHGGDVFLDVWRWLLLCPDESPRWKRVNGHAKPQTVHARKKFDGYLESVDLWIHAQANPATDTATDTDTEIPRPDRLANFLGAK